MPQTHTRQKTFHRTRIVMYYYFLFLFKCESFVSLFGKYVRSTRPSQIFQLRKSDRKTRMLQVVTKRAQRLTPKQIRFQFYSHFAFLVTFPKHGLFFKTSDNTNRTLRKSRSTKILCTSFLAIHSRNSDT